MEYFILRLMVGGIMTHEVECTANVRDIALRALERAVEVHGAKAAFWVSLYVGGFPPGYAGVRDPSKERDPEWICDFTLTGDGKLELRAGARNSDED